MADEANKSKKGGGIFGSLVQAESMIQLALALPAGCVIGWFIGMLLDRHFHTDWIQVVGIIVGAVAGFVQIFTTASKFMKRGR
jgi:F0F1-type ATP synthase assembly protein I